ncbi:hypothetical protein [Prolixibacter denitrificans]|uniref:Lipocalin-like protein n=1 Tax=Prolixibacter denitrificans TaxID=1541063 RepID=A0A2P8C965_9BACT|nr:hypothetical protein [Prolixibacter denitrificans]PSK81499.1 hypothetical protein CLV93_109105 [Prolixibacter denitrificans]GET21033.1 hypothetical protein JCM18694_12790 [Prolixibacter denitrificans]
MRLSIQSLMAIMLLLFSSNIYAQKSKITGFWAIETVSVGNQNMTPVAKWTKINADGSFQSGNGWLQNSQGSWSYDAENKIFTAVDPLGIKDEFGGFTVSFDNEKMYWQREEEGMPVKVTLSPIQKLPMAPADYLVGLWDLTEITKDHQSILKEFDSGNKHRLFIRWDRRYINFSPQGKKLTGYWHMNAHKPELTFLPHQEGEKPESWRIEVNKNELVMTGISDSNRGIERKYMRRNAF